MENNITLIGMPGAGKSTAGIILAKLLSFGFIDTDILIQINQQRSLQSILDSEGYLTLREIEEQEILKLNIANHIVATGGSAVYGENAMKHLCTGAAVIYLQTPIEALRSRISNFDTRGIAKEPNQSFAELFAEREALYTTYATATVNTSNKTVEEVATEIATLVR